MLKSLNQVDFPVGFAELKETQPNEDLTYYVEWLDNNSEFPGLTNTNTQLNGGNWEFLKRKELDQEEPVISEDENAWSKVSSTKTSYVEIAEKNVDELKPSKRTVQSLWTNNNQKKDKETENQEEQCEEYGQDAHDDIDIFNAHKSQSRNANRSTHLHKLHRLKIIDYYVDGILRIAISGDNKPTFANLEIVNCEEMIKINNKSEAIRYSSKVKPKKRSSYKDLRGSKKNSHDLSEYSIIDAK